MSSSICPVAFVQFSNPDINAKTLSRYNANTMTSMQKRTTIYFDPTLHRALRIKAAENDRSVSDLVNEAVRLSLDEDAEDLASLEEREHEPNLLFEDVVKDLKQRGEI